jgi:hypothetical protein
VADESVQVMIRVEASDESLPRAVWMRLYVWVRDVFLAFLLSGAYDGIVKVDILFE